MPLSDYTVAFRSNLHGQISIRAHAGCHSAVADRCCGSHLSGFRGAEGRALLARKLILTRNLVGSDGNVVHEEQTTRQRTRTPPQKRAKDVLVDVVGCFPPCSRLKLCGTMHVWLKLAHRILPNRFNRVGEPKG